MTNLRNPWCVLKTIYLIDKLSFETISFPLDSLFLFLYVYHMQYNQNMNFHIFSVLNTMPTISL